MAEHSIPQSVIILRGGPATGKSTVGQALRDQMGNAICISVDAIIAMIKRDFSLTTKRWAHMGARHLADLFVHHGWHVIFEELFIGDKSIQNIQEWAKIQGLSCHLFHLTADPKDVHVRNMASGRGGVLTEERLITLTRLVEESIPPNAHIINTSAHSVEQCVGIILAQINRDAD